MGKEVQGFKKGKFGCFGYSGSIQVYNMVENKVSTRLEKVSHWNALAK